MEPHLSGPHLSVTCLVTNYDNKYVDSDSLSQIFSYSDSQYGNEGGPDSEGPL